MIVIVKIDLSSKPDKKMIADMRRVANEFSNDKKSIEIRKFKHEEIYRLETRFYMKTVAQYKVVDQIFYKFELALENYDVFLDISVSFQK